MEVVVTFSFIAFIFALLDSKRVVGHGLTICFLIVGALGVLHYDYGNDYMSYYKMYTDFINHDFSWREILEDEVIRNNEYVWGLLMLLVSPLGSSGFYLLVAIVAVIENWAFYYIIKRYVPRKWWWLAVFIYLFTAELYVLNFSMLRQGLAVALFLLLFDLLVRKKVLLAIGATFILSGIHSSALVILAGILMYFIPLRLSKIASIAFIAAWAIAFLSESFISSIVNNLLEIERFGAYDLYLQGTGNVTFRLGYFLNIIPFFLSMYLLFTDKIVNHSNLMAICICSIAATVTPISSSIPMVARIATYFNVYAVVSYPVIYEKVNNKLIRNGLLLALVVITLFSYFGFFSSPIYERDFRTFHTIFEANI